MELKLKLRNSKTVQKFFGTHSCCMMKYMQKKYGISEKAVFKSFDGKLYSDNPRAMSEALHEKNSGIEIVWLFADSEAKKSVVPPYVRCVKNDREHSLRELATARFWVANFGLLAYLYKLPEQFYIQTWHGDHAIKKILYDSSFSDPNEVYFEEKHCDLYVAESSFGVQMCRLAFRYQGEVVCVGSPRNDRLIYCSNADRKRIRRAIGVLEDVGIVLFAPTLRRKPAGSKVVQDTGDIDLERVLLLFVETTKKKRVCLIRVHSAVAEIATGKCRVPQECCEKEDNKMKQVITYGTFDLPHYGHINLLRRAKALRDYLVAVVSSDEFNWNEKHKKWYFIYEQRKMLVEAIRYVDFVIHETNWEQKKKDVHEYHIDTFVMGDDGEGKFDFLKEEGVEVVYLPRTPEISTTQIKKDLNSPSKKRGGYRRLRYNLGISGTVADASLCGGVVA